MSSNQGVYARAQIIVVELTGRSPYLADDEEWAFAVDEARERLGILERAPVCIHCGDVAPYGDPRIQWISHHQSGIHRWWQKMKRKWRKS